MAQNLSGTIILLTSRCPEHRKIFYAWTQGKKWFGWIQVRIKFNKLIQLSHVNLLKFNKGSQPCELPWGVRARPLPPPGVPLCSRGLILPPGAGQVPENHEVQTSEESPGEIGDQHLGYVKVRGLSYLRNFRPPSPPTPFKSVRN